MITLYQYPASPFCIIIDSILKFTKAEYKLVNLPYSDRRLIVKKTKGDYYKIPLLEDGKKVIWEKTDFSQDIARYLDKKFDLDLFPLELEGIQTILARYIESEVERSGFKLNDIHYKSLLPDLYDQTMMKRHKERKFGIGCLETWQSQKNKLLKQFKELLIPLDQMLSQKRFLLDNQPRFVDFDLFGIIGNYLFSGKNKFPSSLSHLHRWQQEMKKRIIANG